MNLHVVYVVYSIASNIYEPLTSYYKDEKDFFELDDHHGGRNFECWFRILQ